MIALFLICFYLVPTLLALSIITYQIVTKNRKWIETNSDAIMLISYSIMPISNYIIVYFLLDMENNFFGRVSNWLFRKLP